MNSVSATLNQTPRSVLTSICYAGPNFLENQAITIGQSQQNVENGVLEKTAITVNCYSRSEIQNFNFQDNGFEFVTMDNTALSYFRDFAQKKKNGVFDEDMNLYSESQARSIVSKWACNRNIPSSVLMRCFGSMYRDTGNSNASQPFSTAHIDFVGEQLKPVVQSGMKDRTLSEIVNIWIPLNELPTENTLAVMDLSSVNKENVKVCTFPSAQQVDTPYHSQILFSNPSQRWIALEDFKLGDALIFKTTETPHGAVNLNRPWVDCDPRRCSLEVRFGCFGPSNDPQYLI